MGLVTYTKFCGTVNDLTGPNPFTPSSSAAKVAALANEDSSYVSVTLPGANDSNHLACINFSFDSLANVSDILNIASITCTIIAKGQSNTEIDVLSLTLDGSTENVTKDITISLTSSNQSFTATYSTTGILPSDVFGNSNFGVIVGATNNGGGSRSVDIDSIYITVTSLITEQYVNFGRNMFNQSRLFSSKILTSEEFSKC